MGECVPVCDCQIGGSRAVPGGSRQSGTRGLVSNCKPYPPTSPPQAHTPSSRPNCDK